MSGWPLWLNRLLPIALIVLAVALVYRPALENSFHFDDFDNIVQHRTVHMESLSLEGLTTAARWPRLATRPLPSVTFAIDWWRGGGQARAFLQSNVLLHIVTTLLVYLLLRQTLALHSPSACTSEQERRHTAYALVGALIWALHPIQTQAVTYVVQRMAILSALFSLLSLYGYIRLRLTTRRRWPWAVVTLGALTLGVLSKENAAITPMLWWLAEYTLVRGGAGRPLIRHRIDWPLLSLPLLLLIGVVADLILHGPLWRLIEPGYQLRDFTLGERLLTQPRVILFHLSQILWPLPERFSIEHDFALSRSLLDPPATLAALALLLATATAGLFAMVQGRVRVFGFCLLFFLGTLVIESSVIPLEMVFEHRLYLPLFSLVLLLLLGVQEVERRVTGMGARHLLPLAVALVAALALATHTRIVDWHDGTTLYESALDNAPTSHRLITNLAVRHLDEGDLDRADELLDIAFTLAPESTPALAALAVLTMERGDLLEAEEIAIRAMRKGGNDPQTLNFMGEIMLRQGRVAEARSYFAQALAFKPWDAAYHWNLSLAHERAGECAEALRHIEQFRRLSREPGAQHEAAQRLSGIDCR